MESDENRITRLALEAIVAEVNRIDGLSLELSEEAYWRVYRAALAAVRPEVEALKGTQP